MAGRLGEGIIGGVNGHTALLKGDREELCGCLGHKTQRGRCCMTSRLGLWEGRLKC